MFLKGANGRRPFIIAVAEPRNAFRQPQIQMLPAVTTGVDLITVAEQGYGFQQLNFSEFFLVAGRIEEKLGCRTQLVSSGGQPYQGYRAMGFSNQTCQNSS